MGCDECFTSPPHTHTHLSMISQLSDLGCYTFHSIFFTCLWLHWDGPRVWECRRLTHPDLQHVFKQGNIMFPLGVALGPAAHTFTFYLSQTHRNIWGGGWGEGRDLSLHPVWDWDICCLEKSFCRGWHCEHAQCQAFSPRFHILVTVKVVSKFFFTHGPQEYHYIIFVTLNTITAIQSLPGRRRIKDVTMVTL